MGFCPTDDEVYGVRCEVFDQRQDGALHNRMYAERSCASVNYEFNGLKDTSLQSFICIDIVLSFVLTPISVAILHTLVFSIGYGPKVQRFCFCLVSICERKVCARGARRVRRRPLQFASRPGVGVRQKRWIHFVRNLWLEEDPL